MLLARLACLLRGHDWSGWCINEAEFGARRLRILRRSRHCERCGKLETQINGGELEWRDQRPRLRRRRA